MKKQYMDFVPTNSVKKQVKIRAVKPRVTAVRKTEIAYKKEMVTKPSSVEEYTHDKNTPKLGVIEDLNPEFKKISIPKRPLNSGTAIAKVKAQKIGNKSKLVVEKTEKTEGKTKTDNTYKTPKTPFINQEKVVKRPLSKNVYQKKVEIPKEEPRGPVAIIEKPEKDAKAGLIVTIILTIILGAAAGTVAFLLLPK